MSETITILDDLSAYSLADETSDVLYKFDKLDFVTRLKELKENGAVWSHIILQNGELAYIKSKSTFAWQPMTIKIPHFYYLSLEQDNLEQQIFLSIGETISIVAPGKPIIIRNSRNRLGKLPEGVAIKPDNLFSPLVMSIIAGIFAFIIFMIFLNQQSIEIDFYRSYGSGRRKGLHIWAILYGLPLLAFVGVSYLFFDVINDYLSRAVSFLSKGWKAFMRQIKIRF